MRNLGHLGTWTLDIHPGLKGRGFLLNMQSTFNKLVHVSPRTASGIFRPLRSYTLSTRVTSHLPGGRSCDSIELSAKPGRESTLFKAAVNDGVSTHGF